MKKYSDYYPYIFPMIIILNFFNSFYLKSNLFAALFVFLFFAFLIYFVLKFNNKFFYLHSKSTGMGGPKFLSFFFLLMMGVFYSCAFLIFLFISSPLTLLLFFLHPIALLLLLLNLPGIYLASKKNFLIFFNKKMDSFPARLFFLIPGGFTFSVLFFGILYIVGLLTSYLDELNEIAIIILSVFAIIGSLITILLFKKSILKDDLPPEFQTDFMEHELYVFMPMQRINDSVAYKITDNPIGRVRVQIKDLVISTKKLKNDIVFTRYGALVVSNKTLEVFEKNSLTGYQIKNVLDERTNNNLSTHFQLVSTFEMPRMSSQTKLKKGFISGLLILDDKVYYDSFVLNRVSDFNKTSEYIGTDDGKPYYHQKFWIVSKKAMEVLINQLGRQKREFIPVYLSGNEKND